MLPQVIEYGSQRTLTTQQLANAYGVDSKSLLRNFQRNRKSFMEGVHYYALTGEELKQFKGARQSDVTLKFLSVLYLWTERGAWQFAKSLRSDRANEAYEKLINHTYQQQQRAMTKVMSPEYIVAIEHRVSSLELQMQAATIHSAEQKRVQQAVSARITALVGQAKTKRSKLFARLYADIKKVFKVASYRDIRQVDLPEAIAFIARWEVSL